MDFLTIYLVCYTAWAAGIIVHLVFFHFGEHHMLSPRYALFAVLSLVMHFVAPFPVPQISNLLAAQQLFFVVGIYFSLTSYRLIVNPVRKFPGPLGCKISSVWLATYLTRKDAFRQLLKLHQKYGNFVQIGSNDLSISHPKAVQAIYGMGSKCSKSDFYDSTQPLVALHSTRDEALHSKRRRLWSTAFGDKNLRDYEKRLVQYRTLLVKAIEDSVDRPIDVTKWFSLYNFDVMGDLAFGHSFDMLKTSKEHYAVGLLKSGLGPLGFKLPAWLFRVLIAIPGAAKNWWGFIDYCVEQLDNRIQAKADTRDIMGNLLKPLNGKSPTGIDRDFLEGDAQLIIVAGSDTTSTTLTTIFRYLAQYPHHVDLLRAEIDSLPRTKVGDYQDTSLSKLNDLNGVINEALRLFPPVPTILPRLTPSEGLDIDGTFIPGNTVVSASPYVIGRSSEAYCDPNEFIPERWYSQPELIRDKSCFAPFSIGTYGCVGKPLAYLNIRTTVSRIIADYDILSAPVERLEAYEDGMTEHFTFEPPELKLSFAKRPKP